MTLNAKALGLTLAVIAGGWWLIVMLFSLLTGIGHTTLTTLGSFHPFFTYSWGGLVSITIQHLIYGFIAGWILAKLYNKFAR